jgi:hypothetical protein
MKLRVDTSGVQFTVTRAAEEKRDQNGKQKADRNTGELLFTVQLMALDETGGEMINVTVAGQPPKVTVGQFARVVELEAIPWATNGRNGTAFRARAIEPIAASAKAA